ncbi:MAG: hypothetical protein AB7G37_08750 [Solirubrobacteraceae bacterium]
MAAATDRPLGFTDHALERFAERGGLPGRDRATLRRDLAELVAIDGRFVRRRPGWAPSRNTADAYVQVGNWLLLICVTDRRDPGRLTVTTVITGRDQLTWDRAYRQGYVRVPEPLAVGLGACPRLPLWRAIVTALGDPSRDRGTLAHAVRLRRDRRRRRATIRRAHAQGRADIARRTVADRSAERHRAARRRR